MTFSKCRYCGAEIGFIKTKAGKTEPVDAESRYFREDPKGCKFILPDGTVTKGSSLRSNTAEAKIGFIAHRMTCAEPDKSNKLRKSDRKKA